MRKCITMEQKYKVNKLKQLKVQDYFFGIYTGFAMTLAIFNSIENDLILNWYKWYYQFEYHIKKYVISLFKKQAKIH